ncbi:MAG: hypothetical protein JEZ11_18405 [Desulfobacterales bacterium]|nr:hypothetical protein [Desulfobacterales bacterium]
MAGYRFNPKRRFRVRVSLHGVGIGLRGDSGLREGTGRAVQIMIPIAACPGQCRLRAVR